MSKIDDIIGGVYVWTMDLVNKSIPLTEPVLGTGSEPPLTPTEAKQALKDLIETEVIGEPIDNEHQEVGDGDIVCITCDHVVDPTDTMYAKECYCDNKNQLIAEQYLALNTLFGDDS